ncbi:M10 family metallopeptidase domain-containing protein [bacterium]|nr:M10 family metallopeptidase domain-containing protein [bacterium]
MGAILSLVLIVTAVVSWNMVPASIDPELQGYVDNFYADAKRYGVEAEEINYAGFFDHLPDNTVGIGMYPNILIATEERGSITLESLVYHELAHAVMGCSHSGDPKSIMYDTNTIYAANNWDSVVESFFTKEYKELCQ